MLRISKYGVCLLVLLVAGAATAQENPQLNDNTVEFDLDGLTLIFKDTPGNPIATAMVLFDGGSALTIPERAGAEDMALAVVSDGGPASMTKSDYHSRLDMIGSSISGSAGFDYSSLSMSCISSEFERTWDLFMETAQEPAFTPEEIELIRTQQLTAIATRMDDPDSATRFTVRELLYEGHPYSNRPLGFAETVESLTREDLMDTYQGLWVRERITVVVVGDLDADGVRAMVESAFADVERFPDFSIGELPNLLMETARLSVLERPQLPTNYILGYFPAPSISDEDYPAFLIATEILSDRLFEEVRTARNLTYAVSAGLGSRRANNGAVYVTATDPVTTIGVIFDTIDGMIDEPVDPGDLTDQIEGYLTRYYMTLQSSGAQAGMLGRWELIGGDRMNADAFVDLLRHVTPEDVSRVMDTYIRNIQFGVTGDPAEVPEEVFTAR